MKTKKMDSCTPSTPLISELMQSSLRKNSGKLPGSGFCQRKGPSLYFLELSGIPKNPEAEQERFAAKHMMKLTTQPPPRPPKKNNQQMWSSIFFNEKRFARCVFFFLQFFRWQMIFVLGLCKLIITIWSLSNGSSRHHFDTFWETTMSPQNHEKHVKVLAT